MTSIENSVDCVIFGFKERQLHILLIKRKESPEKGPMVLPGDFLSKKESLDTSAKKTLKSNNESPKYFFRADRCIW